MGRTWTNAYPLRKAAVDVLEEVGGERSADGLRLEIAELTGLERSAGQMRRIMLGLVRDEVLSVRRGGYDGAYLYRLVEGDTS